METVQKMQEMKRQNSLERELEQLLEKTLRMECELYSVIGYRQK